MSGWKARRFWKDVTVVAEGEGYAVSLDARRLLSPHKTPVVLPNRAFADAVAAEWAAQEGTIDPGAMPMTRMANSALDKVAPLRLQVIDHLAQYGETDLLCYRAERPESLVARQSAGWDPVLDWAEETLGARLRTVRGVMPVAQDGAALSALRQALFGFDDFELTGLHDLIGLSGSLVLGIGLAHHRLGPDEAWSLSRIDEDWQAEQWGEDPEAQEAAEAKRAAFLDAWRCICLSRGQSLV